MTPLEQVLMVIIGVAFIVGGAVIAKGSIDSKNLIEVAIFGLLGVGSGLFLIITAICGPPTY